MLLLLFLSAALGFVPMPSAWQTDADPLDHTKWRLVSTEKAGELKLSQRPATILFDEGRYSISACNTMNGKYSIDGKGLRGSAGISTPKACLPEAQAVDEALLKAITINHSFEVEGKQLTITDDDGGTFLFRAVALPSKNAVKKFIYVGAETRNCTGNVPMKCLQIRESKDQPWTNYYGSIIGFHPTPGHEYRLRIKEDTVKNPPADAPNKIWYLDMVIEQTIVGKAAADAFEAQKKK
jgi:heat shock protein HslJ